MPGGMDKWIWKLCHDDILWIHVYFVGVFWGCTLR